MNDRLKEKVRKSFHDIVSEYGRIAKKRQERIEAFLRKTHAIFLDTYKIGVGDFLCDDRALDEDIGNCSKHLNTYYKRVKRYLLDESSKESRMKWEDAPRPYNILLVAPPGAGKSCLAKSLADSVLGERKDHYKEFNLSWVETLKEFEDMLCDIQKRADRSLSVSADSPRLGFFLIDECDSFVTYPVFQKLLMPIWDGKLIQSGTESRLPPCVLIFASSIHRDDKALSKLKRRILTAKDHGWQGFRDGRGLREIWREEQTEYVYKCFSHPKQPKGLDFLSRIHDFLIIPSLADDIGDDSNKSSLPSRDMDRIIRLVHFVLEYWKNVTKIDKAVLCFLASLESERLSVRDLENIIFKSNPPEDNRFRESCLPPEYRVKFKKEEERDFGSLSWLYIYKRFQDFKTDCARAYEENEHDFRQAFEALDEQHKEEVLDSLASLETRNPELDCWLKRTYSDLVPWDLEERPSVRVKERLYADDPNIIRATDKLIIDLFTVANGTYGPLLRLRSLDEEETGEKSGIVISLNEVQSLVDALKKAAGRLAEH